MTIDAAWIDYWAERYPMESDEAVLNAVGPAVSKRGSYDRADLLAVGRWKSRRALSRMASNTDDMIRDITATALAAPISIRHRIMTLLNGVGVPMASALLTAWNPRQHTVIDVRAVNSLFVSGEIRDPAPKMYPPYMDYLMTCTAISERCGRSLRTLDRALYMANGDVTRTPA